MIYFSGRTGAAPAAIKKSYFELKWIENGLSGLQKITKNINILRLEEERGGAAVGSDETSFGEEKRSETSLQGTTALCCKHPELAARCADANRKSQKSIMLTGHERRRVEGEGNKAKYSLREAANANPDWIKQARKN